MGGGVARSNEGHESQPGEQHRHGRQGVRPSLPPRAEADLREGAASTRPQRVGAGTPPGSAREPGYSLASG